MPGDLPEAEEIVQEAYARASTRWARLRDYDAAEAWVRRVARNLATDRGRRLQRQARALPRAGPTPPAVPPASVEAMALADALRTLPIHQRQAIVLHHLVDLPLDELAAILGTGTGTVKSWLARGRRALAAGTAVAGRLPDRTTPRPLPPSPAARYCWTAGLFDVKGRGGYWGARRIRSPGTPLTSLGGIYSGSAQIEGRVTKRAARVRLRFRDGRPPMDLTIIKVGNRYPASFFVGFFPQGPTNARKGGWAAATATAPDAAGRTVTTCRVGPPGDGTPECPGT